MSAKNEIGWTSYQYSLFRFIFGSFLCLTFLNNLQFKEFCFFGECLSHQYRLWWLPNFEDTDLESQIFGLIMVSNVLAAILSAIFAMAYRSNLMALMVAVVWILLAPSTGPVSEIETAFVVLILVLDRYFPHFEQYSAEKIQQSYSIGQRRVPATTVFFIWILLILFYFTSALIDIYQIVSGETVLPVLFQGWGVFLVLGAMASIGVRLLFVASAWWTKSRRYAWLAVLLVYFPVSLVNPNNAFHPALLFFHLLAMNPFWIAPRPPKKPEMIFYDGTCGLCHWFVRFALFEDRKSSFRFAPLQGQQFAKAFTAQQQERLPDSIVVLREDGKVLVQCNALRHVGQRLGGVWRVFAQCAAIVPSRLRNWCYDRIARSRKRWSRMPNDLCPLLSKDLMSRFYP